MRTHSFIIACLALVLYSCGGELAPLDPEEECIKTWTVEINNPEASVSIENGILIVDIQLTFTNHAYTPIQYYVLSGDQLRYNRIKCDCRSF